MTLLRCALVGLLDFMLGQEEKRRVNDNKARAMGFTIQSECLHRDDHVAIGCQST
jgi:hypothetical protein